MLFTLICEICIICYIHTYRIIFKMEYIMYYLFNLSILPDILSSKTEERYMGNFQALWQANSIRNSNTCIFRSKMVRASDKNLLFPHHCGFKSHWELRTFHVRKPVIQKIAGITRYPWHLCLNNAYRGSPGSCLFGQLQPTERTDTHIFLLLYHISVKHLLQ